MPRHYLQSYTNTRYVVLKTYTEGLLNITSYLCHFGNIEWTECFDVWLHALNSIIKLFFIANHETIFSPPIEFHWNIVYVYIGKEKTNLHDRIESSVHQLFPFLLTSKGPTSIIVLHWSSNSSRTWYYTYVRNTYDMSI